MLIKWVSDWLESQNCRFRKALNSVKDTLEMQHQLYCLNCSVHDMQFTQYSINKLETSKCNIAPNHKSLPKWSETHFHISLSPISLLFEIMHCSVMYIYMFIFWLQVAKNLWSCPQFTCICLCCQAQSVNFRDIHC